MAELRLQGLTKRFGEVVAVRDLTVTVESGELVALLGPSGCGKTTTLRMVAGFEAPTQGRVVLGGRDVTDDPPERRNCGMVFQHYALFPHLTVEQNVAFGGLRSAGGWGRSSSGWASQGSRAAIPASSRAGSSSGRPWRAPS